MAARRSGKGRVQPSNTAPSLGARDPRHRIARQTDGFDEDPEAFDRDRQGRQTVRLDPLGGMARGPKGHRVEVGDYLHVDRSGRVTLDLNALLGPSLVVDQKGRVTIDLKNLRARKDGRLEIVPANYVAPLTDSTAGTTDGTLEAVPSASLVALAAAANNNFAEVFTQLGAIRDALGAAGYGIGEEA